MSLFTRFGWTRLVVLIVGVLLAAIGAAWSGRLRLELYRLLYH
jgi:hypothetical protein